MLAEEARPPVADPRHRDQQPHRRRGAQPGEVDLLGQDVAQRVNAERVELIGRDDVRRQGQGGAGGGHRGLAAHGGERHLLADALPEPAETPAGASSRPPTARPSAKTTAFTAPALVPLTASKESVFFFEQTVEHAPGEGAERAAALQGQRQPPPRHPGAQHPGHLARQQTFAPDVRDRAGPYR